MRAPVLAIGDGALGFWAALREVFPDSREQRCRVHKIAAPHLVALVRAEATGVAGIIIEREDQQDAA